MSVIVILRVWFPGANVRILTETGKSPVEIERDRWLYIQKVNNYLT